ncbi:D-lactate dehydrogenase [Thiomicrospira aerophila AL3]|uniref:D-lactate dehydrogenase n=1 Tax=Thiomicrospira aerophila AL3 TaxID=717772 RepID=W0DYJ8_9GAMM|nr:2-hydroxyacid dehydrogenase [Thiomicrospira aerophila]AHF01931.1 D-lactate dehydrogenase [Thiomicrospira aerophila AL3]
MKVAVFSTKPYDKNALGHYDNDEVDLTFLEVPMTVASAHYAQGFQAVSAFVNDDLSEPVLSQLKGYGIELVTLRCAGFNNVDLAAAKKLGIKVTRVPAYSPYAVAEHTIGMMLALSRKIYKAYNRVREGNFSLNGLLGFDFYGKTVGIIGAGKIGLLVAKRLQAFGCRVLVYDPYLCESCAAEGFEQVPLDELYAQAHIISMHCPLTPETTRMINNESIAKMRQGVMIINTGRGALIDTKALISGLKTRHIGYVGLDVYEEEGPLFFEDHSDDIIQDDHFERLLTFPNVLVTGHQAYFTHEALEHIAETTIENLMAFKYQRPLTNEVPFK